MKSKGINRSEGPRIKGDDEGRKERDRMFRAKQPMSLLTKRSRKTIDRSLDAMDWESMK